MLNRCFYKELPAACRHPDVKWIAPPDADASRAGCTIYRCRITLAEPLEIRLHLAADSVYRLWIDGEFVAEGAEIGDHRRLFVESRIWRAAAGDHVLVAAVPFFGPRGAWARMDVAPGFFCAAEGGGADQLDTNPANWQCADAPMFGWQPPFGWVTPIGEELIFDASQLPEGLWRGTDSTCDWRPVSSTFGGGRELLPSLLPDMSRKPVTDFRVLYHGANRDRRFHAADNFPEKAGASEQKLRAGEPLTFPANARVKLLIALSDYGCILPEFTVSGGRGGKLSLGWAEALFVEEAEVGVKADRRQWQDRWFVGFYDYFLSDGRSEMEFFTFTYRSGCYLALEVETADQPLTLQSMRLWENCYPLNFEASFACGDTRFAPLAKQCLRTLEMCSHDSFMDCPYYERLMYVGDTRIQSLMTLAGSRDARLVEKSLRLIAAGQLPSGFVPSRYPSRFPQEIPTYTPFFIGMAADYARWRGGGLPRELLKSVLRAADAFEPFRNAFGLAEFHQGWNFVDWTAAWPQGTPPYGDDGVSGVVNAHMLYGYKECAEFCRLLGETTLAQRYELRLKEATAVFIDAFWDQSLGAFRNAANDPLLSEHQQILMLLTGALPQSLRTRSVETLAAGKLPVRTTSYFDFYLFEVCARYGLIDRLAERLGRFFDMAELGLKTMAEQPEPSRSDCHAWSAHPLYHFYATLLGIRPAGYGFREVEIRPQPGTLAWMRGSVVHPGGGEICLSYADGGYLVRLPAGLTGTLVLPDGRCEKLRPGEQMFEQKNPANRSLQS